MWPSVSMLPAAVMSNVFRNTAKHFKDLAETFEEKAREEENGVVKSSGVSIYQVIDGVKYDRSCLDLANHLSKDGELGLKDATQLWDDVMDGPGVTDTERRTIQHVLNQFPLTEEGKEFLLKKVTAQSSGVSIYQVIDGVRYDRSCLDLAEHLNKDGKLGLADATQLWDNVLDGPGVTDTERRTIQHVLKQFPLTKGGKEFLLEKLGEQGGSPAKGMATATPTPKKKKEKRKKSASTTEKKKKKVKKSSK